MSQIPFKDLGWRTERLDVPYDLANRLSSDSRRIGTGQWFLPIQGEHFDGHDFIKMALERGAAGFFYSTSKQENLPRELRSLGIEVDNTSKAIQDLARWWRRQLNCKIIAITGSSGKTTVKEMAAVMLGGIAPTLKTEGSLNNELGVPLTLCSLSSKHKYAVIEMGARHKGDIAFLSQIAEQDLGVLLNVGSAHIGEFGGVQNILEAKMEITAAPTAVYCSDDIRLEQSMCALRDKTLTRFGRNPGADVQLLNFSLNGHHPVSIDFLVKGQRLCLNSDFYHKSFPINAAACLAIGTALGLDPSACLTGLQSFQGIKGRFKLERIGDQLLIDDCYNANPESMAAGLETLREAYGARQKNIILGDMMELGDKTESAHRSIGALCTHEIKPSRLITIGPQAAWIGDEAVKAGLNRSQHQHFAQVEEILPQIHAIWRESELLYVKASHSLRFDKIIDKILNT
ncbi:MAG: UDP-N-acetylmuramoyl-tripeptide--D-alanyl-D-alanine ligase [Proteobacteria bacterium]|nr:UDP-N-acetylmuramoyl-tripeptide--D-alanyl-D-alanine ligase [Pseudomonadota bacterium]